MEQASLLVMVVTSFIVHWKYHKYISGSFLAALISTVIISLGALFFGIDHVGILINTISVFVLSLLVSAIIGFFFDKKRNKEAYKEENNRPERLKENYLAMEVALTLSGVAMILLALLHSGTPLYVSLEGIVQLAIVYLLRKRLRWAGFILVGYVSLALLTISAGVFADIYFKLGFLSPKELAGTIIGAITAGWLCFKGARAYKKICAIENCQN